LTFALSSIVIASTGHASTHAPQEIQISSSTTADMGGSNEEAIFNFFLESGDVKGFFK
jgi:hypothetical protein